MKDYQAKIRKAFYRSCINVFLEQVGLLLTVLALSASIFLLYIRLGGPWFGLYYTYYTIAGIFLLLAILLTYLKLPTRMQIAIEVDKRNGLRERFSTMLAFEGNSDPFAVAAFQESLSKVNNVKIHESFPIKFSRKWRSIMSLWLLFVIFFLTMPQKDLWGWIASQEQQKKQQIANEQAKQDVVKAAKQVELALKSLDDPELGILANQISGIQTGEKPEVAKREAIKKMGQLSEQIKKNRPEAFNGYQDVMKKMLRQMRPTENPFMQELDQALAKGEMGKAATMLKQMAQDLDNNKLPDEQKKQLQKQFNDIAKQLQKIAAENKTLQNEFEKAGLSPEIAKMNPEDLKKKLQDMGLTKNKIEQLMQNQQACNKASSQMQQMANALSKCSNGSEGMSTSMSDAANMLSDMEAFSEQLKLAQSAMDQINQSQQNLSQSMCLNPAMCNGNCTGMCRSGSMGQFSQSGSLMRSNSSGSRGQGSGEVSKDKDGNTGTESTKVIGQNNEGPIVASWYFKGPNVRGESRKQFSDTVKKAKDAATDAINENEIPAKYEDAVKRYFGNLEK